MSGFHQVGTRVLTTQLRRLQVGACQKPFCGEGPLKRSKATNSSLLFVGISFRLSCLCPPDSSSACRSSDINPHESPMPTNGSCPCQALDLPNLRIPRLAVIAVLDPMRIATLGSWKDSPRSRYGCGSKLHHQGTAGSSPCQNSAHFRGRARSGSFLDWLAGVVANDCQLFFPNKFKGLPSSLGHRVPDTWSLHFKQAGGNLFAAMSSPKKRACEALSCLVSATCLLCPACECLSCCAFGFTS